MTGAFTARNPDRVKRIFMMNTLFGYGGGQAAAGKTPWFQWIEKHEEAGTLQGILGELGSTVLSVMKIIGFQNTAAVDDTWIRAYSAPFPDRESCIGAINFPLDVHYQRFLPLVFEVMEKCDLEKVKAKPAMLVSGDKDYGIAQDHAISDFKGLFPNAPVVKVEGVGHFCQEDIPETLVALLQGFIQANPSASGPRPDASPRRGSSLPPAGATCACKGPPRDGRPRTGTPECSRSWPRICRLRPGSGAVCKARADAGAR